MAFNYWFHPPTRLQATDVLEPYEDPYWEEDFHERLNTAERAVLDGTGDQMFWADSDSDFEGEMDRDDFDEEDEDEDEEGGEEETRGRNKRVKRE